MNTCESKRCVETELRLLEGYKKGLETIFVLEKRVQELEGTNAVLLSSCKSLMHYLANDPCSIGAVHSANFAKQTIAHLEGQE
jgi:hypothetical protein